MTKEKTVTTDYGKPMLTQRYQTGREYGGTPEWAFENNTFSDDPISEGSGLIKSAIILGLAVLVMAVITACSTLRSLPSLQSKDISPRQGALITLADVEPIVELLAHECENGTLTRSEIASIYKNGTAFRETIGTYAASARACVVVAGKLLPEKGFGRNCFHGDIQSASRAMPLILKQLGLGIGGETGRNLYLLSALTTSYIGNRDGGFVEGYQEDIVDIPLEEYDELWAPVRANADRLQACVAAKVEG